jgi:hypothetical protein
MKHSLLFVKLTVDQIELAKKVNGMGKKISYALLCGPHGQLFGTEIQCRKYFSVWKNIFPLLFADSREVENVSIENFKTTDSLVMILIAAQNDLSKHNP